MTLTDILGTILKCKIWVFDLLIHLKNLFIKHTSAQNKSTVYPGTSSITGNAKNLASHKNRHLVNSKRCGRPVVILSLLCYLMTASNCNHIHKHKKLCNRYISIFLNYSISFPKFWLEKTQRLKTFHGLRCWQFWRKLKTENWTSWTKIHITGAEEALFLINGFWRPVIALY